MFPLREVGTEWNNPYMPLQESTIMNLWYFPVFDTMGDVRHCTNFLISRIHNDSLCLYREYPIHVDDIHHLIDLSIDGDYVTNDFQGLGKCINKKWDPSIHDRFNTRWGGIRALIDPILPETIHLACYMIPYKFMRTYMRGECTLGAILVVDFYA